MIDRDEVNDWLARYEARLAIPGNGGARRGLRRSGQLCGVTVGESDHRHGSAAALLGRRSQRTRRGLPDDQRDPRGREAAWPSWRPRRLRRWATLARPLAAHAGRARPLRALRGVAVRPRPGRRPPTRATDGQRVPSTTMPGCCSPRWSRCPRPSPGRGRGPRRSRRWPSSSAASPPRRSGSRSGSSSARFARPRGRRMGDAAQDRGAGGAGALLAVLEVDRLVAEIAGTTGAARPAPAASVSPSCSAARRRPRLASSGVLLGELRQARSRA